MTFSMVHLEIKTPSLVSWARNNRHTLADKEYLVHTAMRITFGEKAPQPFEVFDNGNRTLKVLGYSDSSEMELVEEMNLTAEPLLMQTIPPKAIRSKSMPDSWHEGRTFGFRVRCCPVSRRSDEKGHIVERDVFLAACERSPEEQIDRETVYSEWFMERIAPFKGAEILDIHMKAFRLREFRRRDSKRKLQNLTRPETIFDGVLKVVDSQGFGAMLREGIGRHKAFGFGAIFLRPSRN